MGYYYDKVPWSVFFWGALNGASAFELLKASMIVFSELLEQMLSS